MQSLPFMILMFQNGKFWKGIKAYTYFLINFGGWIAQHK
jgi:hypothetical protein